MLRYLAILFSAVAIALIATPFVRQAATRFGVTDQPSTRKIHSSPVPLLGGLAIWIGCVLSLLLFEPGDFIPQFGGILAGATLASLVGIWDDRWGMKPRVKLLGQVAATALMVASGTRVQFLGTWLLTAPVLQPLGTEALNLLAAAMNLGVTVFWVVAITNALNLMDNMDGLAGGVAGWAAFFFFLLALMTGQMLVAPLALALAGGCIGFLYYNFKPGHIFMGDTGSLLLGFLLAAVGIKLRFPVLHDPISGLPMSHQEVTWLVPLLVLGLPIFDTTLVSLSRIRRGLSITRGGRDHVSHRLVALGASRREAVLILYLACTLLGVAAFAVTYLPVREAWIVAGLVFAAAVVAFWRLEQVPLVDTNPPW